MRKVFIEMEKLKNLNSGLGQLCLRLGSEIVKQQKNIEATFYVPKSRNNIFGKQPAYVFHSSIHKLFTPGSRKYDVWHSTHQQSKYLPDNKHTKFILSVHDLNFMQKYSGIKQQLKLKTLQKKIDRADAVVFLSHYTEKIVRENLNVANKQTEVIYTGISVDENAIPVKPTYMGEGKFLFSIGIIGRKKNFHVLIPLLSKLPDYKLVIAGSKSDAYADEIVELAKKYNVFDRLILPGSVNENEKKWLYLNCEAFLFPSLAEGFGMPPIEAMSLGKPVFLSTYTSLPEVGGSEAFYFQNFEPEQMKMIFENGMKQFYSDAQKTERIVNWTKQFSWAETARKYIHLYETI